MLKKQTILVLLQAPGLTAPPSLAFNTRSALARSRRLCPCAETIGSNPAPPAAATTASPDGSFRGPNPRRLTLCAPGGGARERTNRSAKFPLFRRVPHPLTPAPLRKKKEEGPGGARRGSGNGSGGRSRKRQPKPVPAPSGAARAR